MASHTVPPEELSTGIDPSLERRLLEGLLSPMLEFPLHARDLSRRSGVAKGSSEVAVGDVLEKFAAQVSF